MYTLKFGPDKKNKILHLRFTTFRDQTSCLDQNLAYRWNHLLKQMKNNEQSYLKNLLQMFTLP
jgi:hypothetical protein